jgi:hypothetical protein
MQGTTVSASPWKSATTEFTNPTRSSLEYFPKRSNVGSPNKKAPLDPPDVARWFADDELDLCPECGEKKVVIAEGDATARVCLACGAVATAQPFDGP